MLLVSEGTAHLLDSQPRRHRDDVLGMDDGRQATNRLGLLLTVQASSRLSVVPTSWPPIDLMCSLPHNIYLS